MKSKVKEMNTYKIFLLIILTVILSPWAMAQSDGSLSYDELLNLSLDELMELDVVTTSKFSTENKADAPSVISVITEDQIKKSGAKNMEEVLRTIAGFDVTRKGISPTTMVGVRGLFSTDGTNNKILFLINGHPYRSSIYNDARVAIGNYPIKSVNRIEVIRGPGSTLYGAGAFLAVINVITKESEKTGEVAVSAGSFDTYEGFGLLSLKGKKGKVSISGNYFNTQGPQIMLGSDVGSEMVTTLSVPYGYQEFPSAVPGSLNYGRNTLNLHLEAAYNNFYLTAGRMDSNDEPLIGAFESLTRNNSINNIGTFAELGYKLPIQDKGELLIKSYYDLYQNDSDLEIWAKETTGFFNYLTTLNYMFNQIPGTPGLYGPEEPQRYRTKVNNNILGGEINFAYNIRNQIKILTGGMLEYSDIQNISTSSNGNIFLDKPIVLGSEMFLPLESFGEVKDITEEFNWINSNNRTISAAFGQVEVNLAEAFDMGSIHNFAVVLGARYDHYSDVGGSFNPRAAVILSPNEKLYFKGLYGEAFRAPSFAELYIQNHPIFNGNPDLKPETVQTAEAVVGFKPNKGTEITVSYFNTSVYNNIQLKRQLQVDDPTKILMVFENIGNLRSTGIELDFNWQVYKKVSLYGSATYQEVMDITEATSEAISSEGDQLILQQGEFSLGNVPNFLFNITANYEVLPFLNLNLGINYLGERNRTEKLDFERDPATYQLTGNFAPVDSREAIPARTLLNASVLVHSIPGISGLEMQFSGYNLLDVDEYNPTSIITQSDIQREGINFLGTLRYKF